MNNKYDQYGLLTEQWPDLESPTATDYDKDATPDQSLLTRIVYNGFGQPVRKYYFDGSTEQVGYDAYGNPVIRTDVDGKPVYVIYDKAGRQIAKRDKHADSWVYTLYNETGQAAAQIINDGITRTTLPGNTSTDTTEPRSVDNYITGEMVQSSTPYIPVEDIKAYDGQIEIPYIYQTNPDFTIALSSNDFQMLKQFAVVNEYDKLGRLIQTTDRKGNAVAYTYDKDGTVLKETALLKETITKEIVTKEAMVNLIGNPIWQRTKDGVVMKYIYDAFGRVKEERMIGKNESLSSSGVLIKSYEYSLTGQVTKITDTNGEQIYAATYDSLGRKISEINEEGVTINYQYNPDNSIKRIEYNNDPNKYVNYHYNRLGSISELDRFGVKLYNAYGFETIEGQSRFVTYECFPREEDDTEYNYTYTKTVFKNTREPLYVQRADGSIVVPTVEYGYSDPQYGDESFIRQRTDFFSNLSAYSEWYASNLLAETTDGTLPEEIPANETLLDTINTTHEYVEILSTPYGLPRVLTNDDGVTTEYVYNGFNEIITEDKSENKFIILFFGHLWAWHDVDTLMHGVNVLPQSVRNKIEFHFIGKTHQELFDQAKKYPDLIDGIIIKGFKIRHDLMLSQVFTFLGKWVVG